MQISVTATFNYIAWISLNEKRDCGFILCLSCCHLLSGMCSECVELNVASLVSAVTWWDETVSCDKNLLRDHVCLITYTYYAHVSMNATYSHTHSRHTHTFTNQSIFPQVRPHAGSITTPHQNVVGEEIDTRQRAGELASAGLIVVTHIGHHIVKLQYFIAFMLLA